MPAVSRHLFAQAEGFNLQYCAGQFTLNGTTITLASTVPLANHIDVTVTRTRTAVYSLVIKNFRGPLGIAVPVIACGSPGTIAPVSAIPSYSTDDLTVAIQCGTSGTNAETDVYFQVFAY